MQSQEHIYEPQEPAPLSAQQVNAEPREQGAQRQEYEYQPYAEGYAGSIWQSEGEKLRPEPGEQRGIAVLLLVLLIIGALAISGSMSGLIVHWLGWLILTLLVFFGAIAVIANWRVVTIPMPVQTFQVSERPTLVIKNTAGTIALHRGEQDIVTVSGVKRAGGLYPRPEKMQLLCNQQNNILNITGRIFWGVFQLGLRRIDMDITVPETCDIELTNTSGRVIVQSISGTCRLDTSSGRIIMSDLQGLITAHTGSGRIEASNLQGHTSLQTGSGRMQLSNIQGQLNGKTGSGRIELLNATLSGESRLKTGSGSITFTGSLDPSGDYELTTGSGRIRVSLPLDASFSLKSKTGSGGVTNEFGSNEVGNLPRPPLKLKTGSGNIRIQRGTTFYS
ncbi:MAG TPA: DUF4097 family beta strand repeat-containing protein [Ktedonosporobacter sp.]|jgi:hypothetical protein|nr:DUF4097 family beta strand repeat-containing protein [Ktedonosporobacter sp.]